MFCATTPKYLSSASGYLLAFKSSYLLKNVALSQLYKKLPKFLFFPRVCPYKNMFVLQCSSVQFAYVKTLCEIQNCAVVIPAFPWSYLFSTIINRTIHIVIYIFKTIVILKRFERICPQTNSTASLRPKTCDRNVVRNDQNVWSLS